MFCFNVTPDASTIRRGSSLNKIQMKVYVRHMSKHILLVEPDYYSPFPPIGLLKLSSYHKRKGNSVELVRGCKSPIKRPDLIYVTSLFTWTWKPVWAAVKHYKRLYPNVEVWLGGIYASVDPEHAALSGADHIFQGVFRDAEDLIPDYSLKPEWDGSIVFSSRGCNRNCGFCAVPKIEGRLNECKSSIKEFIWPPHSKIFFFDNNFLWNPYKYDIFAELRELNKPVDFNQGLDARLIDSDLAENLSTLPLNKTASVRLAYDGMEQKASVEKAIQLLSENGISKRKIFVYTLFNYHDTPDEFLERVVNILNWGAICYPMRYEPLRARVKNRHISSNWTREQVEAVQKARRVIGFSGIFPPYRALIDKFERAGNFDEAFELRTQNKKGGI